MLPIERTWRLTPIWPMIALSCRLQLYRKLQVVASMIVAVSGCADLQLPEGFTFVRHGATADVSCAGDDRTYKLTCVHDEWHGRYKNCTSPADDLLGVGDLQTLEPGRVLASAWLPFSIGLLRPLPIDCIKSLYSFYKLNIPAVSECTFFECNEFPFQKLQSL